MNSATFKIILAILAVFSVTMLWNVGYHWFKHSYVTETAVPVLFEDSISFRGVYIRDEEIIEAPVSGGVVSYAVPDGGKLGKGSVIAEIYDSDEQIKIKREIDVLKQRLSLLKKISNPGTSEVAQPSFFLKLITQKFNSTIYDREKNNIGNISSDKEDLLILISTMQMAMQTNDEYTNAIKQEISDIEYQIQSLSSRLTAPEDTVTSPRSCYFVSYTDGYEDELSKSSVTSLTVDYINSIDESGIYNGSGDGVLGKIIDGYEWYIAGVIDNSRFILSEDESVTVKFESMADGVGAFVEKIISTDNPNESIIILSCDTLVYELVQHRTEEVKVIRGEYQGIKVPRSAIRVKDVTETVNGEEITTNCRGVYVKLGEQVLFKKLSVIYDAEDYVITQFNMSSDYVSLYDDVIVEGIDFNDGQL